VSDAIIQLEHVSKRFGQQLAVDDVTVEVPRGRCFAWLGPNGCGKTTLIRMMLGLARPSGGSIHLRGLEVPKDIRAALSRVGGIVEEPRFYPYLSGRRNLDIWAAHYGGEARSRIPSVLERVELTERAGDKVKTYSLGMRQRLGVARALLNDPELLVLDEPTNGLDPAGMLEFRNMIRDLIEKEGRTVFISSHILDEVQKMADDIAIVQAGRLISWGPVGALIASGRHSVLLRTRARRALGDRIRDGSGPQRGVQGARPRGRRHQRRAPDRNQPHAIGGRRRRGRDLAREREPRGSLPRAHRRQQAGRHDPREEARRCWQLRFGASSAGAAPTGARS
jgi:ABC-type multidrug transport system ATPase subunit